MEKVKNHIWLQFFFILLVSLFVVQECKNKRANNKEESVKSINWIYDIDSALSLGMGENKLLMIDFMAEWCPSCRKMEDSTFRHPEVVKKTSLFIPVRIDVDQQREIAIKYNGNASKYGGIGIPNILFMTGDEKEIRHIVGYYDYEAFLAVLDSVLNENVLDKRKL